MSHTIKKMALEEEKDIVTGMIINDIFISDISKILKDMQLIKSIYFRQLTKWCLEYFKKYKKAPQGLILDIFAVKKADIRNESDIQNIEDVLQHLTTRYFEKTVDTENYNYEYFYDQSAKYLKKRKVELLIANLQVSVLDNNIEEANNYIAKYKPVQKPTGDGIDLLKDTDKIIEILTSMDDSLFDFPGVMGEAWKNLYRGDLISLGAPQKRGKTWFLVYIAAIALFAGLKVCYWTKEMKNDLMVKRLFQFFLGEIKSVAQEFSTDIRVPYFDNNNNIKYKITKKNGIGIDGIVKVQRNIKRQSRTGSFKLFDLSTGGGSIVDIDRKLENLAYYDDFNADVVLVDYFDILDPAKGASRDKMEALNEIWKAGKSIAQQRNLLMCTASQMNRKTFSEEADVEHISDDIRKFGHVSHWANLRQTKEEKARQLLRVQVQGRHDGFLEEDVVVTQCLSIGRPVLDCRWKKDIPNYEEWLDTPLEELEKEEVY